MDGAAFSYGTYKQEVKNWICDNFEPGASILDVGAGSGTYGNLLKDKYHNIDGVEIYYPNIIDYKLLDLYRAVYCRNIVGLEYPSYDLIIFGDVIEHLSVEDAQKALDYARNKCRNMIVAVPYRYHQEGNENEHERHIQDDLTKENVLERYPFLKPLYTNFSYGYYIKNE